VSRERFDAYTMFYVKIVDTHTHIRRENFDGCTMFYVKNVDMHTHNMG
jgi:hypothetical protein